MGICAYYHIEGEKMRHKLLPEITMLTAGVITCVIALMKRMDTVRALTTLLIVMIGFYIIGLIAKMVLNKVFFAEHAVEEENLDEEQDIQKEEGNPEGEDAVEGNKE